MVLIDDLLDLWSAFVQFISRIYCVLVTVAFTLYNSFRPRVSVPKVSNPILLKTATVLAHEIGNGEISSLEVVSAFINRIKEVQPIINAVTEDCFEEALVAAEECDRELANMDLHQRSQLADSKPLFGLPFTTKDSVQVLGKKMTWGNPALKDCVGQENAVVIERMIDAGAILLAITNVPENCVWVEGTNSIYGYTCNPYDNRRSVGGSSSGEGALVSACGSVLGIGSDIGGSIRIPSAKNGIFGLKPTSKVITLKGALPEEMNNPYLTEFLNLGPMTKTVEDLTLLYKILGGQDAVSVLDQKNKFSVNKIFCTNPVANWVPRTDKEQRMAMNKALKFLKSELDCITLDVDIHRWGADVLRIFHANSSQQEGYKGFRANFELVNGGPYSMSVEFCKYLCGMSKHSLAGCFAYAVDPLPETDQEKEKYIALLHEYRREAELLLGNDSILILPTWPCVAPYHDLSVFHLKTFQVYTMVFNMVDLPVIAVPMGLNSEGLPLSIQIVGPKGSDGLLIDLAHKLETEFGGWCQP